MKYLIFKINYYSLYKIIKQNNCFQLFQILKDHVNGEMAMENSALQFKEIKCIFKYTKIENSYFKL